MAATQQAPDMARKAKRNDETVKVDAEVVRQGRIVASFRGISLAEYFTELLRGQVQDDFNEHVRQAAAQAPDRAGPRRK